LALERVVSIEQPSGLRGGLFRCGLQLAIMLSKGHPLAELFVQGAGRSGSGVLAGLVGDLVRSFVLLQQALELGSFVPALACKVLLGIVQLVLVESELRLGKF
jgi:hypothetical protein